MAGRGLVRRNCLITVSEVPRAWWGRRFRLSTLDPARGWQAGYPLGRAWWGRRLFGLTASQIHREGSERNPFLSLAMLQVEALGGAVGAHPPVGIRRQWGALDADCLDVGFADIPGFAAVVGLVEFVAVAARARAVIDHQRAARLIREKKLLDGAETGLIEDRVGTPGLAAVGSHEQKRVLRERGEGEAAGPAGFDLGEL